MSSKPLALEGIVEAASDHGEELRSLRRENQRLDEVLRNVRNELGQVQADKENLERSVRALRTQLAPLHRALRAVFGEIELAVGEENFSPRSATATGSQRESANDPRWESWKTKLPGRPAEMIDLLLLHKSMSTKALMAAMHCAKDTVYQAAYKLGQAGLLASNSPYSLKDLL